MFQYFSHKQIRMLLNLFNVKNFKGCSSILWFAFDWLRVFLYRFTIYMYKQGRIQIDGMHLITYIHKCFIYFTLHFTLHFTLRDVCVCGSMNEKEKLEFNKAIAKWPVKYQSIALCHKTTIYWINQNHVRISGVCDGDIIIKYENVIGSKS